MAVCLELSLGRLDGRKSIVLKTCCQCNVILVCRSESEKTMVSVQCDFSL